MGVVSDPNSLYEKPSGFKIGWVSDRELCIDPEPTLAVLHRLAQGQSDTIAFTKHTLVNGLPKRD